MRKTLSDFFGTSRVEVKEMSDSLKKDITEFLDSHKDLVVIIADPDTDTVVAGHKEHLFANRITDKKGVAVSIVSDMLKYNKEDAKIRDSINQFLLLIDGMIHNIAKQLKENGKVENNK